MTSHQHYMQQALSLAKQAAAAGEVPVGAVIVLAAIGAMFNAYGAAWRVADYRKSGVRIMLITLRGA